MSTTALTSLAILKVNWDRLGRDYIENFVPFVAEALRHSTDDVVSLPQIQGDLKARFGLDLPLNPLRQVLQRAAKHGFVRRQSGVFYRSPDQLADLNFSDVRNGVVWIHDRVLERFRDFVRREQETEWSEEEAAAAIYSFLAAHSLKLLYAAAEGLPMSLGGLPRDSAFVVASFVTWSRENDRQLLDDFGVLVKGHLLANAIYLPDAGKVRQRFRGTTVYLDTSVMVYAAGFAGPERQAPCDELLRLLVEYGAELRCFDRTVDEVRGILDASASRLRKGQLRDAYGPTVEWFIESGRSASDVELMLARLPEKLRSIGIGITGRPARQRDFQVDESGFEAALEAAIGYRNPAARVHDVDCVSAIVQLRRGQHSFDVESCGAIFVTSNVELARVARQFFQPEAPDGAVALCMTDYALGNLLWLKNPTRAPDLPMKILIADAFAAIQPSDALWKMYLTEIARLQERGEISGDEYFALRHLLTAKRTLMELTAGDPAAFTEGTVAQVLQVAKENLRADLLDRLEQERRRREGAESSVSQLEQKEVARRERLHVFSVRVAKVVSRCAFGILLFLLTGGALLTFPWSLPQLGEAWYRYLTTGLLVLFFAYTVASMAWGTTVSGLAKRFEERVVNKLSNWVLEFLD